MLALVPQWFTSIDHPTPASLRAQPAAVVATLARHHRVRAGRARPAHLRHPGDAGHRLRRSAARRRCSSVLIGVSAAYLGGFADDSLSLVTDVFLVIPTFPLIIVIAAYVGQRQPHRRDRRARRDRLVVWRPPARVADPVAAQPRLPRGGAGARRAAGRTSSCSRCCPR